MRGFSIVELTVALGLTLALMTTLAAVVHPAQSAAAAQSEGADMAQRARVGAETLAHDIQAAGAGLSASTRAGPMNAYVPAVFPCRCGVGADDPVGTFRSDAITLVTVPTSAAQTTLSADAAAGAGVLLLAPLVGCAGGSNLCAFSPGTTVIVYGDDGAFDLVTVTSVGDAASLITTTPTSAAHRSGTAVAEVDVRSYYLKVDAATQSRQLIRAVGASPDVPLLDHVVALGFEYFAIDRDRTPVSVAAVARETLTDGPWRPGGSGRRQWDADLLRVRSIAATIRIEAANAALRGPAGTLFANAGTATSANRWAIDRDIRIQVAPRNLSLW